jgi:hypothetical protein
MADLRTGASACKAVGWEQARYSKGMKPADNLNYYAIQRRALALHCSLSFWPIPFLAVTNVASLNTTQMTQHNPWEILVAELRQSRLVSQAFITDGADLTR